MASCRIAKQWRAGARLGVEDSIGYEARSFGEANKSNPRQRNADPLEILIGRISRCPIDARIVTLDGMK